MGVDTKGLLISPPTEIEVLRFVQSEYGSAGASITVPDGVDLAWVNFWDGDDLRNLAVFPVGAHANDYGDVWPDPAMLLSLGHWGNSVSIMRTIIRGCGGGFILPKDTEDDWLYVSGC